MKGVLAETFTNIIESKFVILHILQEFLSSVKLGKAFCLSAILVTAILINGFSVSLIRDSFISTTIRTQSLLKTSLV